MSKIIALITACGRGTRFSSDGIPKQYQKIAGETILRHSVLAFLNHSKIDDVICVINRDDLKLYEQAVRGLDLINPVYGGKTRQDSVRKGLEALSEFAPDKVLIHDAVRPFVSKKIINGILEKLQTHPAVIPAVAVEDTIKKYSDGKIEWTLERQDLWRAQTPQGFLFEDIINSHRSFKGKSFTDDSALNEYAGIPVAIIPGSQNNFKITTKEDLERGKNIISSLNKNIVEEIRSGIGYDVHAFRKKTSGENNFIRICGVDIEHSKKIRAHSDGDVGIHAAIDALLGAISKGDIGDLFPDGDPKYKDADSLDLLKEANYIVKKNCAKIINLDITIICEEPRISIFKSEMKNILANTLEIESSRINVKGTTTEKMGFLGKKQGIAAQAIANVKVSKTLS